jgi:arabinose-5-phosphate isomerase
VNADEAVARGRRVLRLETEALARTESRLGPSFADAVRLIAESAGRVIVAGVGKSGIIGRKIAATMTSTGTPATFLHPVESIHGDLGIVGKDDVAILLSKSGETAELLPLLEQLSGLGVKTIAITGGEHSTLAKHADVWIDASVEEEACPHDLAPTTSSTVALAIGDALAVTLLERKGFRREDFARLHPGGSLGRRLLTVKGIMLTEDLPILGERATVRDAWLQVAQRRGLAVIVDEDGALLGVVTAGDLARRIQSESELFSRTVDYVMTRSPRTARSDELASAVVYRMQQAGIMAMPVTDDANHVLGIVHLHDILRAGAQ